MLAMAACGRQVTGLGASGNNSIPTGQMLLRFRVQGPFDFNNFTYAMVFNTTGNGGTPYANTYLAGFQNYSIGWFVGGPNGVVSNPPTLIQYFLTPGSSTSVGTTQIVVPSSLAQLTLNSNGNNTEFTLIFNRTLFDRPPFGQATAAPSSAPSASASPTPSPGSSASPQPGSAYTYISKQWFVNFFVLDRSGTPIDALGFNGRNDTSFSLPLPTDQFFDQVQPLTRPAGSIGNGNASATISGGEILNNP